MKKNWNKHNHIFLLYNSLLVFEGCFFLNLQHFFSPHIGHSMEQVLYESLGKGLHTAG